MNNDQVPVPAPAPTTPVVFNETISDVNSSALKAFFGQYRTRTQIILGASAGWIVLWLFLAAANSFNPGLLSIALGLPAIGITVHAYFVFTNIRHQFYRQFAAANGFGYSESGWLPNVSGALFNLGHGRKMQDIITGGYDGNHLDMFTYQYTVGSGKNQHTYNCTVAQIEYPTILPDILLVVDSQYFGGIVPLFSKWEKLEPAAAFDRNYDLYCKKEFEIEALQIFTPDFMEKILTDWPQFNLEFNGAIIYVFCNHTITTKAELEKMYGLLRYLITRIEPVALRMKSSLEAMEEAHR